MEFIRKRAAVDTLQALLGDGDTTALLVPACSRRAVRIRRHRPRGGILDEMYGRPLTERKAGIEDQKSRHGLADHSDRRFACAARGGRFVLRSPMRCAAAAAEWHS